MSVGSWVRSPVTSKDPLVPWMSALMPPLAARAKARLLETTAEAMRHSQPDLPDEADWQPDHRDVLWLLEVLANTAAEQRRQATEADRQFREFTSHYYRVEGVEARLRVAEDFLRTTVEDPRRLRGDLRALRRYLDHEALQERHHRRVNDLGQQVELCLQLIERAVERLEAEGFEPEGGDDALNRYVVDFLGLIPFLLELANESTRWTTRVAAFKTLCFIVERALGSERQVQIDPRTLREIVVAGQSQGENLHIQRDATRLMLLVDPEAGTEIVERRLLRNELPGPKDDFLYRASALRLVTELFPEERAIATLRGVVEREDPSEHVRMTLARTLGNHDHPETDELLLEMGPGGQAQDPSPRVRAAASEAWSQVFRRALDTLTSDPMDSFAAERADRALDALEGALRAEQDSLAKRVAVDEAVDGVRLLLTVDPSGLVQELLQWRITQLLDALAATARGDLATPAVAFVAAAALAELRPLLDPLQGERLADLRQRLRALEPGQRLSIPLAGSPQDATEQQWGELLLAAGQREFGLSAKVESGRLVVQRGDRRRRSLWRILHELRRLAPDKRKAYSHTIGLQRLDSLRAPPLGMAAITPTVVPGEPVISSTLGSWGPHLPTVEDFLDAARSGRPLSVFHPHGTTTIQPPTGSRRTWAIWKLRWRFGDYDLLRQRSITAADPADRTLLLDAMAKLGFGTELQPAAVAYEGMAFDLRSDMLDPFFPARPQALSEGVLRSGLAGLPTLTALADQAWNYAVSAGGNSQAHLGAFLGALGAVLLGDAVVQAARIRRWRNTIPLVIGGWGTRGKSGTERLKAALFHGLGYEVMSKTTGCEAMVIHSAPGIEPREIFLYRPYDKASIWEQRDVLQLASRMGAQVMLWECMALQPRYVEILSLEWMKDDIATLTNCYPDHEDVQGPAGRDVAETISRFIPQDSKVLTSEQEMAPVLRAQATRRRTRCLPIADRDAEMIPQDLLDRFPYREHPRNIALVAALAEELGIGSEFAIVAMADHVVPDVGSLKVFPVAEHRGRRITYINGHSANERTGFLNNWRRTDMADFSPLDNPGIWTGGVVNNRDDRVPRSRVFAAILAGDVSAHMLCLIGTNLGGFTGYMRQSLGEVLEAFRLGNDQERARERYTRLMSRLHMPRWDSHQFDVEISSWLHGCGLSSAQVEQRLNATGFSEAAGGFLTGLSFDAGAENLKYALSRIDGDGALGGALDRLCDGVTGDERDAELRVFVRRQLAITGAVAAAARAVEQTDAREVLTPRVRKLFTHLMLERVRPLADPSSKGDQVLDFVITQFPPGVHARVMGMQNIKGTGLDFVYRWVFYEQVTEVLTQLGQAGQRQTLDLLRWLRGHPDYGLLDAREAHRVVSRLRTTRFQEWADVSREAELLEYFLKDLTVAKIRGLGSGRKKRTAVAALLGVLERGLDYLHSVHRRRRAWKILDDLVEQRVSHARAAALMRELTVSQKGGWLTGSGKH